MPLHLTALLALASITGSLVTFATHAIARLGLAGVGLLMLSTGVIFLPGTEPTMLFAGFDVYQHTLSLAGMIIAGLIGDIGGALIAYAIGRYGREGWLQRRLGCACTGTRSIRRGAGSSGMARRCSSSRASCPWSGPPFPTRPASPRCRSQRFAIFDRARLDPVGCGARCARTGGRVTAGRVGATTWSTSITWAPRSSCSRSCT